MARLTTLRTGQAQPCAARETAGTSTAFKTGLYWLPKPADRTSVSGGLRQRRQLLLVFEAGLPLLHKRCHPFLLVLLWEGRAELAVPVPCWARRGGASERPHQAGQAWKWVLVARTPRDGPSVPGPCVATGSCAKPPALRSTPRVTRLGSRLNFCILPWVCTHAHTCGHTGTHAHTHHHFKSQSHFHLPFTKHLDVTD